MQKLMHSKIIGNGNPLLILHGFLGMGDNWVSMANKYAEQNFQVHLIDQRNHGKSFHADEMSYEEMSADLWRYIKHYDLNEIVLLGHSMGGKTAMDFSIRYPDSVQKMIVADIAPRHYPPHHHFIFKALDNISLAEVKTRNDIEKQLHQNIDSHSIRQFLMKNLKRDKGGSFQWKANMEILRDALDDLGEELPARSIFSGHTLFIRGEKSPYIQPSDFKLIKAHFPNSAIETIQDAGHWLHAEQPEQFFQKTIDFLKKS